MQSPTVGERLSSKRKKKEWNSVKTVSTAKNLTHLMAAGVDALCFNHRMPPQFLTALGPGKKL
jgi:hypothetical protein